MHLFKNKTKDVKQFLQEMKANKTNQSSHISHLAIKDNKSETRSSVHQCSQPSVRPNQFYKSGVYDSNKVSSFYRQKSCQIENSKDSMASHSMPINSSMQNIPIQNHPTFLSKQYFPQDQKIYRDQSFGGYHYDRAFDYTNQSFYPQPTYNQSIYNSQVSHRNKKFYGLRNDDFYAKPVHSIQPYHPYQSAMQNSLSQNSEVSFNPNVNRFYDSLNSQKIEQKMINLPQNPPIFNRGQQNIHQNPNSYNGKRLSQNIILDGRNSNQIIEKSINHEIKPNKNIHRNSISFNQKKDTQKNLKISQISSIDYEMDQISEADVGLSTEKNTPTKTTELISKSKHETNNFISHQSFNQIIQTQKVANNKKKIKQLISQPFKIEKATSPIKIQVKVEIIKIKKTDKLLLENSLYQIDQVHIKLYQLLRQNQIIFNNIQRSKQNFNKIISKGGSIYQILNRISKKNRNKTNFINQNIQSIEQNTIKQKNQKLQTKQSTLKILNQDKTFKKYNNYQKDVQI